MKIELIFLWIVHQVSLWWRGLGQLGNGQIGLLLSKDTAVVEQVPRFVE